MQDRYITIKDNALTLQIRVIYNGIYKMVKDASYLHYTTKNINNPHHFESIVREANETIEKLVNFFHPEDNRKKIFKLIDGNSLLKEAKEFFERDIY